MSEIENRKAGRVLATATVAAVVGLAAGAGAMLWLRGGMPPVASVSDAAPTKAGKRLQAVRREIVDDGNR